MSYHHPFDRHEGQTAQQDDNFCLAANPDVRYQHQRTEDEHTGPPICIDPQTLERSSTRHAVQNTAHENSEATGQYHTRDPGYRYITRPLTTPNAAQLHHVPQLFMLGRTDQQLTENIQHRHQGQDDGTDSFWQRWMDERMDQMGGNQPNLSNIEQPTGPPLPTTGDSLNAVGQQQSLPSQPNRLLPSLQNPEDLLFRALEHTPWSNIEDSIPIEEPDSGVRSCTAPIEPRVNLSRKRRASSSEEDTGRTRKAQKLAENAATREYRRALARETATRKRHRPQQDGSSTILQAIQAPVNSELRLQSQTQAWAESSIRSPAVRVQRGIAAAPELPRVPRSRASRQQRAQHLVSHPERERRGYNKLEVNGNDWLWITGLFGQSSGNSNAMSQREYASRVSPAWNANSVSKMEKTATISFLKAWWSGHPEDLNGELMRMNNPHGSLAEAADAKWRQLTLEAGRNSKNAGQSRSTGLGQYGLLEYYWDLHFVFPSGETPDINAIWNRPVYPYQPRRRSD